MLTSNMFEFFKVYLVFKVCASMPVIPHAFAPPRHFWVFECFLASAKASTVVGGQDPNLPETLLLPPRLFTLNPLCNFHSTLHTLALFNHLHRAQSLLSQAAQGQQPHGAASTSQLNIWIRAKHPEPSSSHSLLCALNPPSRDSYQKPFTPRVDRCSPRITCGSPLWDL